MNAIYKAVWPKCSLITLQLHVLSPRRNNVVLAGIIPDAYNNAFSGFAVLPRQLAIRVRGAFMAPFRLVTAMPCPKATCICCHRSAHGAMSLASFVPLLLDPEDMPLDTDADAACPVYALCFSALSIARRARSFRILSGLGPVVDDVTPFGTLPMGRCILAAASGSFRSTPCRWYVDSLWLFSACADGSLVDSQFFI